MPISQFSRTRDTSTVTGDTSLSSGPSIIILSLFICTLFFIFVVKSIPIPICCCYWRNRCCQRGILKRKRKKSPSRERYDDDDEKEMPGDGDEENRSASNLSETNHHDEPQFQRGNTAPHDTTISPLHRQLLKSGTSHSIHVPNLHSHVDADHTTPHHESQDAQSHASESPVHLLEQSSAAHETNSGNGSPALFTKAEPFSESDASPQEHSQTHDYNEHMSPQLPVSATYSPLSPLNVSSSSYSPKIHSFATHSHLEEYPKYPAPLQHVASLHSVTTISSSDTRNESHFEDDNMTELVSLDPSEVYSVSSQRERSLSRDNQQETFTEDAHAAAVNSQPVTPPRLTLGDNVIFSTPSRSFISHSRFFSFKVYWIPLSLWAVSLFSLFILVVSQLLSWESFKGAFIGSESNPISAYSVLLVFFSFSYLCLSLDATGLLRAIASIFLNVSSRWKLLLAFQLLAGIMTLFTSNDIVILTLTPILCYVYKTHCNINISNEDKSLKEGPTHVPDLPINDFSFNKRPFPVLPYALSLFYMSNICSIFFVIGNPTNIIVAEAQGLNFGVYTLWMALPTIVLSLSAIILSFCIFSPQLCGSCRPVRRLLGGLSPSSKDLYSRTTLFASNRQYNSDPSRGKLTSKSQTPAAQPNSPTESDTSTFVPEWSSVKDAASTVQDDGVETSAPVPYVHPHSTIQIPMSPTENKDLYGSVRSEIVQLHSMPLFPLSVQKRNAGLSSKDEEKEWTVMEVNKRKVGHSARSDDTEMAPVWIRFLKKVLRQVNDPLGVIFKTCCLFLCLATLFVMSFFGVPTWIVSLSFCIIFIIWDVCSDVARIAWSTGKHLILSKINIPFSGRSEIATLETCSGAPTSSRIMDEDPKLHPQYDGNGIIPSVANSTASSEQDGPVSGNNSSATWRAFILYQSKIHQQLDPFIKKWKFVYSNSHFLSTIYRMPWSVAPFALCMFVYVELLRKYGWVDLIAEGIAHVVKALSGSGYHGESLGTDTFASIFASALVLGVTGILAANIINNQPATILFIIMLSSPTMTKLFEGAPYSKLAALLSLVVASNIAANLTIYGALAGILWKGLLKENNVRVSYCRFLFYGILVVPALCVIGSLLLSLEVFAISRILRSID